MNKNRKNLNKQIEFVARNLSEGPGGLERDYILKLKDIINGMDSDNDDIRAKNEDSFLEEIIKIATPEYYEHLEGYIQAYEKTDLYKACMFADPVRDFEEWDRIINGFRMIVESALYRIVERY